MTLFFSISFSDSSSKMHFLIASGIAERQVHISFFCILKPILEPRNLSFVFSKAVKTLERVSQSLKFDNKISIGVAKVVGT